MNNQEENRSQLYPFELSLMNMQDSYKYSHHADENQTMYPENMSQQSSYAEARGGKWTHSVFFGLQAFQRVYLNTVPSKGAVKRTARMAKLTGIPFNYKQWMQIADLGYYPISIESLDEGLVVPTKVPLIQIRATLPEFSWLVSFIETSILRAIWYTTTVATHTAYIRNILTKYAQDCGIDDSVVDWMLHNFGSRGCTCTEADILSGMAHLTSFFGTDSFVSLFAVEDLYNTDFEKYFIGGSIPATEHSTITAWGKDFESDAYENLIRKYGDDFKVIACVSDSYNIWEALKKWKALEPLIIEKGIRLVIRPDSADPVLTPVNVIKECIDLFGYTVNEKGFKVLPEHIRVIQGDGVDGKEIANICEMLIDENISIENIAFGQGGSLVQKGIDRDTQKFAQKLNEIELYTENDIGNDVSEIREVFKDPIGTSSPEEIPINASFKRSKAGRQAVVLDDTGEFTGIRYVDLNGRKNMFTTRYHNGHLIEGVSTEFAIIRERVKTGLHKIQLT